MANGQRSALPFFVPLFHFVVVVLPAFRIVLWGSVGGEEGVRGIGLGKWAAASSLISAPYNKPIRLS